MSKRIVITGAGAVGPLGHDLSTLAANLERDAQPGPHGELRRLGEHAELRTIAGLDASSVVSRRLQRKLDPFSVHGMVAASQALADSALDPQALDPERVGIYVGNCLGGWAYTQPELQALHARGVTGMGPYVATAWFPAALQGQLSLAYGFKGHSKTFSARDVAGLQAIGHAAVAIEQGRASVVLCGASEDLSSPYLQAVLQRFEHANARQPSPFGGLAGRVFSDGAAFLVMEELSHAQARGARVLCEITGFADRFCPRAEDAPAVMAQALQAAEGRGVGERLLLLDGLQRNEAALARQALGRCGNPSTPIDARARLGNQFAVSGVTEVALAARALGHERLSAATVLGAQAGGGRYAGALVQRLSPQGGVVALGLAAH